MRSILKTAIITAAGLLLFSQFAQASDGESGLRERAGSALSSLLENTEIGGIVAPSYNYNFEGHHNGSTAKANAPITSHPNTNSFQLDQAFIYLDNAATEDSRGGAHLEYEWGVVNSAGKGGKLFSAYISYLAPIHEGVNLDVGLLPTMVGAEVVQTNENFNVTRGLVWGIQPITNVGAVVGGSVGGGFSAAIGVLNDPLDEAAIDGNNEKAVTAQLGYGNDDWSAAATIVWGESATPDVDTGIYDLVINCNASDDVSAWFNYTLRSTDSGADEGELHGIAAAARMALSDELGISLRGEALLERFDKKADNELYSITLTSDYALSEHLTAKGEVRLNLSDNNAFTNSNGTADKEDVAAIVLAQFIYEF